MMTLPEYAGYGIGEIVYVGGRKMTHMGDGLLLPEQEEIMAKRFDPNDFEPLHRTAA